MAESSISSPSAGCPRKKCSGGNVFPFRFTPLFLSWESGAFVSGRRSSGVPVGQGAPSLRDFYPLIPYFSLAPLLPFMYFTRDKSPSGACHRAPLRGPMPMPFRISSMRLSAKGLCNVSKLFPFPRIQNICVFYPSWPLPAFSEAFPSPKDKAAPPPGRNRPNRQQMLRRPIWRGADRA